MSFLSISTRWFFKVFRQHKTVIYTQMVEPRVNKKSNAIKGLNFPIRQLPLLLNITIKQFPFPMSENTAENDENFCCLYAFSAQHTTWMSRSCMFDYVLTILLLSQFSVGMKISRFWFAGTHNAGEIKQRTVDEEIIVQFSAAIARTNFHLIQNMKVFNFIHLSKSANFSFISCPRQNFKFLLRARSHTTWSAAISSNNGKPRKPQTSRKNPFEHALFE